MAHLALFGSAARGAATPASDVDVIVDSPDGEAFGLFKLARIADSLEKVLQCRVDVISRKGLNHATDLRNRISPDIVDVF